MKIGQESPQEMNSAPVVTALAGTLPIMRLPKPAMIAASKGRKTIALTFSALHLIDVVDRDRAAAAEVDDEDGEADRGFGGGDGEHEHREHLAGQIAQEGGKGDEVDVH